MAQTNDVSDRVRTILEAHLGVESEKVTDEASIIDDLGADSLDHVELAMAIEQEFSIEVSDDEFEKALTVADVIKLVSGRIA